MRGSRGRAIAAAWIIGAVPALGLPGPASAAHPHPHPQEVNITLTGALTVAWTGDPAHGCARAGLCGVSGSLEMVQGDQASSESGGGTPPLELSDTNAVARVQTTAPDGAVSGCADLVPVDVFLDVRKTRDGPRATIDPSGAAGAPSSGRCAGPTATDISTMKLPARRLGSRGYDLSGQTSVAAGPFVVTAISTVRVHFTYGNHGGLGGLGGLSGGFSGGSFTGEGSTHGRKPRPALQESAVARYRVTGVSGVLDTDFAGVASPLCDGLGVCGANGSLTQTISTLGTVTFAGTRLVSHPVGLPGALADLRRGRLLLFDSFGARPIHEKIAETLSQTGDGSCTDTSSLQLATPPFTGPHHGVDELQLPAGDGDLGFGAADPFRTRCPGPSSADIIGARGGPVAAATVTAGELGDRHLSIIFRPKAAFSGPDYTGRRTGSVVVSMTLVRQSGGTRRVKRVPHEPLFPPI
ncbi:MAG: hypothetical protein WAU75_19140 [Solirubrobacteraceae bacterium]